MLMVKKMTKTNEEVYEDKMQTNWRSRRAKNSSNLGTIRIWTSDIVRDLLP